MLIIENRLTTCNTKKTFSGMISGLPASDIFKFLELNSYYCFGLVFIVIN